MVRQIPVIATAALLMAVSLFENVGHNETQTIDESAMGPTVLEFEQATALIQIDNPLGQPATLYRIDGNTRVCRLLPKSHLNISRLGASPRLN